MIEGQTIELEKFNQIPFILPKKSEANTHGESIRQKKNSSSSCSLNQYLKTKDLPYQEMSNNSSCFLTIDEKLKAKANYHIQPLSPYEEVIQLKFKGLYARKSSYQDVTVLPQQQQQQQQPDTVHNKYQINKTLKKYNIVSCDTLQQRKMISHSDDKINLLMKQSQRRNLNTSSTQSNNKKNNHNSNSTQNLQKHDFSKSSLDIHEKKLPLLDSKNQISMISLSLPQTKRSENSPNYRQDFQKTQLQYLNPKNMLIKDLSEMNRQLISHQPSVISIFTTEVEKPIPQNQLPYQTNILFNNNGISNYNLNNRKNQFQKQALEHYHDKRQDCFFSPQVRNSQNNAFDIPRITPNQQNANSYRKKFKLLKVDTNSHKISENERFNKVMNHDIGTDMQRFLSLVLKKNNFDQKKKQVKFEVVKEK